MSKVKPSIVITGSAFCTGLALWLAWPEKGFAPLIFVAWVPLLLSEHFFFR